jgi:hypothetical protein
MASSSQGLRIGIQVLLGILIVVLGYVLYVSVTEPYKVVERQREMTRLTRERMDYVRQAMIRYEVENERYPLTLDSLVMFVRDSLSQADVDSLFGAGFNLDSLTYSPRTGKRFELSVNDTARVKTYLLEDPDSDDQIGTVAADVTRLNAASWE